MQTSGGRQAYSLLGASEAPSFQQQVPVLPHLRELELDNTDWPPRAYKQALKAAVSLTRLSLSLCHPLPNVNFLKHATALRDLNILGDPMDSRFVVRLQGTHLSRCKLHGQCVLWCGDAYQAAAD